jgi:hypothetical protein
MPIPGADVRTRHWSDVEIDRLALVQRPPHGDFLAAVRVLRGTVPE